MNSVHCGNFHVEKTSPDCPYCIVRMLTRALELRDPNAPELTPAMVLLEKAKKEREWARRTAR
jgi:hypothetical protein